MSLAGSCAQEVVVKDILSRIKVRINTCTEGDEDVVNELKDLCKEIEEEILSMVKTGWY